MFYDGCDRICIGVYVLHTYLICMCCAWYRLCIYFALVFICFIEFSIRCHKLFFGRSPPNLRGCWAPPSPQGPPVVVLQTKDLCRMSIKECCLGDLRLVLKSYIWFDRYMLVTEENVQALFVNMLWTICSQISDIIFIWSTSPNNEQIA